MKDIEQQGLDLGLGEATKLLSKRVKQGRMSEQAKDEVLGRIDATLDDDNLGKADFVVEAVVENPDIKRRVLADVESRVAEDAILVSNTSTISISSLAKRWIGQRISVACTFFNPVHRMPLVKLFAASLPPMRPLAVLQHCPTKWAKKP